MSESFDSPQVFIGFNAQGQEVYGSIEERQAFWDRNDEVEAIYGGDHVDYEDDDLSGNKEKNNGKDYRN